MTYDLDRFKQAHESDFATALAELRAGRKQTHWIWYVFPQLRGLGLSPLAERYGLDGVGEAEAYLRDPVLLARLRQAAEGVRHHLHERQARLDTLMGSRTDAMKVVSSMTLFEHVARALDDTQPSRDLADLADTAAAILAAAASQGYPRCQFTLERL